jgi:8-oxo-dGTP diphosphatase
MTTTPFKRYVVGLMFDELARKVVLIRKNRPNWQVGRLNGVGGHIDFIPGEVWESPIEAMVREFAEETGVETSEWQWGMPTVNLMGATFEIFVFAAFSDTAVASVRTNTDETVETHWVTDVLNDPTLLPNLRWIIPFSIDPCAVIPLVVEDAPARLDTAYSATRAHV